MNQNRPEFWKAWQAMALVSTTMLESEMLSTLYAYNAYNYFFFDQNMVNETVLPVSDTYFTIDQRVIIYKDPYFGLDSVRKLITWVIAADGARTEGSPQLKAYNLLLKHFEPQGMTEDKMDLIIGSGSMLQMILSNVRQQIFFNTTYGFCPEFTEAYRD